MRIIVTDTEDCSVVGVFEDFGKYQQHLIDKNWFLFRDTQDIPSGHTAVVYDAFTSSAYMLDNEELNEKAGLPNNTIGGWDEVEA